MKKKLLFGIIIFSIAIIFSLIIFIINKNNNHILFRCSYENHAWGSKHYGYIIYSNGKIEEFDSYNEDKELKKAKISKEELKELTRLLLLVKDEYHENTSRNSII